MGTTKQDKLFLWLKVIHELEDLDGTDHSKLHKKLRELNKKFYIKERKTLTKL